MKLIGLEYDGKCAGTGYPHGYRLLLKQSGGKFSAMLRQYYMIGCTILEGKFPISLYMIAIYAHLYYAAQFSSCNKENPWKTCEDCLEKREPPTFLGSHTS